MSQDIDEMLANNGRHLKEDGETVNIADKFLELDFLNSKIFSAIIGALL